MLTRVSHFSTNINGSQSKFSFANLFGNDLSLFGVTSKTKVFIIHSFSENIPQYLNIDQEVTTISSGNFDSSLARSFLVVGTRTRFLIYDAFDNATLCDKEVDSGVLSLAVGRYGDSDQPFVFVGGSCALQAFNIHGEEKFWSVMSDNVLAVILTDFDNDGQNEMIVGTEDSFIRFFKHQSVVMEIKETESVIGLTKLSENLFAYALSNGTIGVYEKGLRLWRIKSKHQAVSMEKMDLDGEGQAVLITGWSHCKFDARHPRTGEVVHKEGAGEFFAGLASGDFQNLGFGQLCVCSNRGEVSLYAIEGQAELTRRMREDDEILRDLLITKCNLQTELQNYEESSGSAVPVHLETILEHLASCGVQLEIRSSRPILAAVIFAEGVFDSGESHVIHSPSGEPVLKIPLPLAANIAADLQVKILVENPEDPRIVQVLEVSQSIPAFANLKKIPDDPFEGSLIRFKIQERLQRLLFWLERSFIIPESEHPEIQSTGIFASFQDLRSSHLISLQFSVDGIVFIKTNDFDLAGDIIQNLSIFLKIDHLETQIDLSSSVATQIQQLFAKIQALQASRKNLTANLAEQVNRSLGCSGELQSSYALFQTDVLQANLANSRSAIESARNEFEIFWTSHAELLLLLKQVHLLIQRASKCRVGRFQSEVISKCRAAVKSNDLDLLLKILTLGS